MSSSRDVTLGMPFGCCLVGSGCCLTLLSSFRVASDFKGFFRDLTKCYFNVQTRPDVKARSSFGAAPSFKKRAIFKQRAESVRELGVSILDLRFRSLSLDALPMK